MKKKVLSAILLIITLLNMVFIFCHSAKNGESSLKESKKISNTVVSVARGEDKSVGKELENVEFRQAVNKLNRKMRDVFHAVEYFPMGLCLTLLFALNLKNKRKLVAASALAFGISLLYAAGDEIHQYFVPGRSCQLIDVCHDAIGFCFGILVALAIILITSRKTYKFDMNQNNNPRESC